MPEKKSLIPVQMPSKNPLMLSQTEFQSVPNQPRNTSATAFKVSSTVEKMDLMPSQIPEKMPLTASHAPLQLPWKRLENTSNRPIRVSRTVPRTVDTT